MDDELQQLEAELQRLRPAEPSPHVRGRIARELGRRAPPEKWRGLRWLWVAALPAAAAIALVWVSFPRPGPGPAAAPAAPPPVAAAPDHAALKPVAAENLLVSAADEGLITLDDGTPARRERLQFVDTITWKNARTNASLTWRVPREEVRVVPVSYQ